MRFVRLWRTCGFVQLGVVRCLCSHGVEVSWCRRGVVVVSRCCGGGVVAAWRGGEGVWDKCYGSCCLRLVQVYKEGVGLNKTTNGRRLVRFRHGSSDLFDRSRDFFARFSSSFLGVLRWLACLQLYAELFLQIDHAVLIVDENSLRSFAYTSYTLLEIPSAFEKSKNGT